MAILIVHWNSTLLMHFPLEQRLEPTEQAFALHIKGNMDSQDVSSHDCLSAPSRARTHSPSWTRGWPWDQNPEGTPNNSAFTKDYMVQTMVQKTISVATSAVVSFPLCRSCKMSRFVLTWVKGHMFTAGGFQRVGIEIVECDGAQPVAARRVVQLQVSEVLGEIILGITVHQYQLRSKSAWKKRFDKYTYNSESKWLKRVHFIQRIFVFIFWHAIHSFLNDIHSFYFISRLCHHFLYVTVDVIVFLIYVLSHINIVFLIMQLISVLKSGIVNSL